MKKINMPVGSKFNKLTILSEEKGINGRAHYKVKCECGTIKIVSGTHLRRKKCIKSCGCMGRSSYTDNISGKIFGRLTAIKRSDNHKDLKWLFQCECGKEKLIRPYSVIAGITVSCGCYNIEKSSGSNSPRWVGGIISDTNGYLKERISPGEYRLQHRVVMENFLRRKLYKNETVHHINGIKTDNRLENLELWYSGHPRGQRVKDLVEWAREIIDIYG